MTALLVALAIVAGILGAIELFRTRLGSLPAWAIVALSLVHVLPVLVAL